MRVFEVSRPRSFFPNSLSTILQIFQPSTIGRVSSSPATNTMNRPVATRVLENLGKYDPIVKRLRQKHPEFSQTIDLVKLAVEGLAKYYGLFILDQHGKLINAARIEDDYSRNVTLIGRDLRTWAKNPDLTLKGKMGLEQLYLVLRRCLRDALELYTESERELMRDGVKIYMSASDGFGEYERAKASLWKFQNEFHLHQIDLKRGNDRAIIYAQPGYSGPPAGFGNVGFSTPDWQEPTDDCIQKLTADEQTQLKVLIKRPEVQKLLPDNLRNPNIALPPSEDDGDNRDTPVPIKKIAPLRRPKPQYLQKKGILKNPTVEPPRNSPKKTVRFGPYREPPLPPNRVHDDSPQVTYLDWATVLDLRSKTNPPTSPPRQLSPAQPNNPRRPVDSPPSLVESSAKRAARKNPFGPGLVDNTKTPDTPSPTTSSSSASPSSSPKPPVVTVTPNTPSSTTSSSLSSSPSKLSPPKPPPVGETPNTPSPTTSSSSSSSSETPVVLTPPETPSPTTSSSSSSKQSAVVVEDTNGVDTANSIISSTTSSSSSKQSVVIVEEKKVDDIQNSIISSTTSSSSSQRSVGPLSPPPQAVPEDRDEYDTSSTSSEEPRPPPVPKKTDEQLRSDVEQSVRAYFGRTHAEYSKTLAAKPAATEDKDEDDTARDDTATGIEDVPYDDAAYSAHHKRGRRAGRRTERDVKRTALLHWAGVRKAKRAERIAGYDRQRAIMRWAERKGKVPLSPSSIRASTRLRRGLFEPLGLPDIPPPFESGGRDVSPVSPERYGEQALEDLEQLRPRLDLTFLAFLFNEDALRLYGGLVGEQPRPGELARMDKILRELEVYVVVCAHRRRLMVNHLKQKRDFPYSWGAQSGDLRAALLDAEEDVLASSRRCFEYVAARSRFVMSYPGNKRRRREFAGQFGPRDREKLEYLGGTDGDEEAARLRAELGAAEEWKQWCVDAIARWTAGWRPRLVEREVLYVDEDGEADVRRYKWEMNDKRDAIGLMPVRRPRDEAYERQQANIRLIDELWRLTT